MQLNVRALHSALLYKMQVWRWRKRSDFRAQTIKQLQAFQAGRVEKVVDVVQKIGSNHLEGQA
jgi:hypothetical protein